MSVLLTALARVILLRNMLILGCCCWPYDLVTLWRVYVCLLSHRWSRCGGHQVAQSYKLKQICCNLDLLSSVLEN